MGDDLPRYILNIIILLLVGVCSYFLKRATDDVDKMEEEVQKLRIKIAIILDRDRRKRLEDYEKEDEEFNK